MRLVALVLALLACSAPPKPPRPPAGGAGVAGEHAPKTPIVVGADQPTVASEAAIEPHRLLVLQWALRIVRASYVDPPRLVPQKLMLAALDHVQRQMAELIVEHRTDDVVVRVNDKHRIYPLVDVDSDDKLVNRLEEIFGFLKAHKNAESDLGKLEYTAMNGLLSALDPHSTLLEPEDSKEMAQRLSGKFGGLGVVIGVDRDKAKPRAIIVREMIAGDTPARRAKLAEGDRIMRINDEPTQNLTTDDASSRLRGDPGTPLVLDIERKGTTMQVRLVRAEITVPAVASRMIGKQVGYLKLDQFSSDISIEVGRAMDELRRKGARSWVMDLRGNSGGYLAEAVKIVDRFVDRGTVVTSVGPTRKRDYPAGASELDDKAPLVVLIDGESASSSEIVAGALKYLDRAILVGTTSFGKGSVQTLHDHPGGARLKITTAQYLTAKGISIQSVGIVPDVQLDRLVVPVKLATPEDFLRLVTRRDNSEADLDEHLTSTSVVAEQPALALSYLGVKDEKADYALDFAADLAGATSQRARPQLVAEAARLVARRQKQEADKLEKALAKLGIDWSSAPRPTTDPDATQLVASFTVDRARVTAGDTVAITGSVTNTGKAPAYQVHAIGKSDDTMFDDTELAFGRIDPGATKRATVHVKTSKAADSRKSVVTWSFERHATSTKATPLAVEVTGLPRPRFAYSYHVVDDNDGLAQPGEKMRLHVRVKNVGPGRGPATVVTLKSLVADRILVDKGHVELGVFEPGQTRDVELAFRIRNHLDLETLKLELAIEDTELLDDVEEEIALKVNTAVGFAPTTGRLAITADTTLRMAADVEAAALRPVERGTVLTVTGHAPRWMRVELAPGRPAFVPTSATGPSTAAPTPLEPPWQATPPELTIAEPARETTADRVQLSGATRDDTRLEDLYIIVYNKAAKQRRRKVFYLSNRGGDPTARIPFSTEIPLAPGSNAITVIARESPKIRTVHTFWVYRRP